MNRVVLGRGLEALIPSDVAASPASTPAAEASGAYIALTLDQIAPNPVQPRRQFDDESLADLAGSLKRDGMLQPLVVRREGTQYMIVAGERRFRAARLAGLDTIPAVVIDQVDDTRMLELALIENIHREDLNPLELAEAYRRLLDQCRLTQQQLSDRLGRSRTAIANTMRLLLLPSDIQLLVRSGRLSEGHARAILALPTETAMRQMAEQIVSGSLSVRQAEHQTRRPARRRPPKKLTPEIVQMESELKQRFGTAVRIVRGAAHGTIEIEFYGDEDLGRIWQLLRRVGEAQ